MLKIMEEVWKDIDNYNGYYQVSNLGRVKSLRFNKQKFLKQIKSPSGYLFINLWMNGNMKTIRVHLMVALCFLNHKTDGTNKIVVDHIDNNKSNNNLSNLQLISHRENASKDNVSKSGVTGVFPSRSLRNPWESSIDINGEKKYLGCFKTKDLASGAYQRALKKINH